ncbi:MAG: myo-inositol-1-phosphate synthase [Planctomycetota bacterium]
MTPPPNKPTGASAKSRRTGLWLIGARGSISTCVAYGTAGLQRGSIDPVGIATEVEPLSGLDLVSFDNLVLGGHDVCRRDLSHSAGELVQAGVLSADLVTGASAEAAAFAARIKPGLLDGPDVGFADLDPRTTALSALSPREQVAHLIRDWESFEEENQLKRTVVVYVASTEAVRASEPEWEQLELFEEALDQGKAMPASVLYAYAAISSGRPFVNFTPSLGARLPALRQLAIRQGVPHCGNDGKTGETLMKTVLAPMFKHRALKVLSWQGYNMLGNRDGEVLRSEAHRQAKIQNKDESLRSILGDRSDLHSMVGIDFVPSLGDWKTAWDFVHFEGFLGARMTLQFTWSGSDSALAAPLVLDLVRLTEYAAMKKEVGEMSHTACFFKDPIAGGTHDFHRQFMMLVEYAASHGALG